jgi:ABC-2 type transport system permease protein
MKTTIELQTVEERGWRMGLANLLRKEMKHWWGSRRWLIHSLLWILIINGFMAFVLFVMPIMMERMPDTASERLDIIQAAVSALFQIGMIGTAVGTIILGQDLVLPERQSGISEWILSKPVSRKSYILSKLLANAVAILVIFVGIPCVLGYALFALKLGNPLPLSTYLLGVSAMALHTLFYLNLTMMMNILTKNRSVVLGTAMGVLFGGMLLPNLVGVTLSSLTPWLLPNLPAGIIPDVSIELSFLMIPMLFTGIWSILFVFIALWKMEKLEF